MAGWFMITCAGVWSILKERPFLIDILLLSGASSLLDSPFLERLSFFGVNFYPSDILVVFGIIMLIFRATQRPIITSYKAWLILLLLFFYAIWSIAHGVSVSSVWIVSRVIVYGPLLFNILLGLKLNKASYIKESFIRIGILSAIINIYLFIFGTFLSDRAIIWGTYGTPYRIHFVRNASQSLVLAALILSITSQFNNKKKSLLSVLILFAGVAVEFARYTLIACIFSIVFYILFAQKTNYRFLSAFKITIIVLLIYIAISIMPKDISFAMQDRFAFLFEKKDFSQDVSLNWRKVEAGYALDTWKNAPFLGAGVGVDYRPDLGELERISLASTGVLTNYIHNAYLWLLVDYGLVGMLIFILIVCKGILHAIRTNRIDYASALVALLASAFVTPSFMIEIYSIIPFTFLLLALYSKSKDANFSS